MPSAVPRVASARTSAGAAGRRGTRAPSARPAWGVSSAVGSDSVPAACSSGTGAAAAAMGFPSTGIGACAGAWAVATGATSSEGGCAKAAAETGWRGRSGRGAVASCVAVPPGAAAWSVSAAGARSMPGGVCMAGGGTCPVASSAAMRTSSAGGSAAPGGVRATAACGVAGGRSREGASGPGTSTSQAMAAAAADAPAMTRPGAPRRRSEARGLAAIPGAWRDAASGGDGGGFRAAAGAEPLRGARHARMRRLRPPALRPRERDG